MIRKFKVLHCKRSKTVTEHKRIKTEDGYVTIANRREVKAGEEGWVPCAYGHEDIHKGDILDFDTVDTYQAHMANKAAANPQFEEVFKEVSEMPVKKKRGRPRKAA